MLLAAWARVLIVQREDVTACALAALASVSTGALKNLGSTGEIEIAKGSVGWKPAHHAAATIVRGWGGDNSRQGVRRTTLLTHTVELAIPPKQVDHPALDQLRAIPLGVERTPQDATVGVTITWRGPSSEVEAALRELATVEVGKLRFSHAEARLKTAYELQIAEYQHTL